MFLPEPESGLFRPFAVCHIRPRVQHMNKAIWNCEAQHAQVQHGLGRRPQVERHQLV